MATALQPQMHDALFDAAQLDVATMRGHVRSHTIQRLPYAILQPDGMESVQEEEIARQIVTDDLINDRLPGVPRAAIISSIRSMPLPCSSRSA